MKLKDWTPSAGWRIERAVHVTECPTCREPSEFFLCDVFGCMNIDSAATFESEGAGRSVTICSKHAEEAFNAKEDDPD